MKKQNHNVMIRRYCPNDCHFAKFSVSPVASYQCEGEGRGKGFGVGLKKPEGKHL